MEQKSYVEAQRASARYVSTEGLAKAVEDAERRIGSYIAGGGLDHDPYVRDQRDMILAWSEELADRAGAKVSQLRSDPKYDLLLGSKVGRLAIDVIELNQRFGMTALDERSMKNIAYLSLALAGEAGELANIVKKIWRDGESEKLTKDLEKEIVDCYIYLVVLVNTLGMDFDAIWNQKHEELQQRYSNGHVSMQGEIWRQS